MLNNEQFEEKTISRKEIYSGKIIDVAVDEVRLPDGGTSKRELVFHPGGVGIIAFDEQDRLLLVKQFRKPLEKSDFGDSSWKNRSRRRTKSRNDSS